MEPLLHLWDLVTSDTMTLAASGVLALAVLALLVLICWPSSAAAPQPQQPTSQRSAQARALVASGVSAVEVARRTGLSRDALALMVGTAGLPTRKKGPGAARLAFWRRATPPAAPSDRTRQVTA